MIGRRVDGESGALEPGVVGDAGRDGAVREEAK